MQNCGYSLRSGIAPLVATLTAVDPTVLGCRNCGGFKGSHLAFSTSSTVSYIVQADKTAAYRELVEHVRHAITDTCMHTSIQPALITQGLQHAWFQSHQEVITGALLSHCWSPLSILEHSLVIAGALSHHQALAAGRHQTCIAHRQRSQLEDSPPQGSIPSPGY